MTIDGNKPMKFLNDLAASVNQRNFMLRNAHDIEDEDDDYDDSDMDVDDVPVGRNKNTAANRKRNRDNDNNRGGNVRRQVMTPDEAIQYLSHRQNEAPKGGRGGPVAGGVSSERVRAADAPEIQLKVANDNIARLQRTIAENTSARAKARWKFALERITTGHVRVDGKLDTNGGKISRKFSALWNWRFCFTGERERIDALKDSLKDEIKKRKEELEAEHKKGYDYGSSDESEEDDFNVNDDPLIFEKLVELKGLRDTSVVCFRSSMVDDIQARINERYVTIEDGVNKGKKKLSTEKDKSYVKSLKADKQKQEKARKSVESVLMKGWRPSLLFEHLLKQKYDEKWLWLKDDCVEIRYPPGIDLEDILTTVKKSLLNVPAAKELVESSQKRKERLEAELLEKHVSKDECNTILTLDAQIAEAEEKVNLRLQKACSLAGVHDDPYENALGKKVSMRVQMSTVMYQFLKMTASHNLTECDVEFVGEVIEKFVREEVLELERKKRKRDEAASSSEEEDGDEGGALGREDNRSNRGQGRARRQAEAYEARQAQKIQEDSMISQCLEVCSTRLPIEHIMLWKRYVLFRTDLVDFLDGRSVTFETILAILNEEIDVLPKCETRLHEIQLAITKRSQTLLQQAMDLEKEMMSTESGVKKVSAAMQLVSRCVIIPKRWSLPYYIISPLNRRQ